MSDKRNSIVAGPGHTLNELTNRLLQIMYQGTDGFSPWEMYPGPLGLYARHCDDFNFRNLLDHTVVDFYNDYIRNPSRQTNFMYDDSNLLEFKLLISDSLDCFYINVFDLNRVAQDFSHLHLFTTILDLPNSKNRHHHLMMEFSTGATDKDYPNIELKTLCRRLVKKHNSEMQFIELIPDCFCIIKADDILEGNFDALYQETKQDKTFSATMKKTVDQYNTVNQCSNSLLLQINEMSWEEIVSNADIGNNIS